MTIRLSSGTSSKCPGPSRTLSWPTQPRERSTTCSGRRLSPTGLPSATTTAWRYSECSVGGAVPTRQGLVCFPPLSHPQSKKKRVSGGQYVFHRFAPTVPRSCSRSSRPATPPLSGPDSVLCGASSAQGWVLRFPLFSSSPLVPQLKISVYLFVSRCVNEHCGHRLCLYSSVPDVSVCCCPGQLSVSVST